MKCAELLTEGLAHNSAEKIIGKFIKFVQQHLDLEDLPTITLHTGHERSVAHKSFGGYGNHDINITISNRHIMDVCRTLAHELVHFKQDLEGRILPDSGKDGSPIENEANAQAAVIMRKWGKTFPRLFSAPAIE